VPHITQLPTSSRVRIPGTWTAAWLPLDPDQAQDDEALGHLSTFVALIQPSYFDRHVVPLRVGWRSRPARVGPRYGRRRGQLIIPVLWIERAARNAQSMWPTSVRRRKDGRAYPSRVSGALMSKGLESHTTVAALELASTIIDVAHVSRMPCVPPDGPCRPPQFRSNPVATLAGEW